MADQQSTDYTKYVGGAAAAIISVVTSIRLAIRRRNRTHDARITQLEEARRALDAARREDRRVMAEIRTEMEDIQIQLLSSNTRLRKVEVNQNDLDREVRDTLQQMIDKIDRRLKHPPEDYQQKSA